MKVSEVTDDKLVLVDKQLDKKLAIAALSVILLFVAYEFSVTGDWLIAAIPVMIVIASWIYVWFTLVNSQFTFDKTNDKVTLVVRSRHGTQEWDWKLSDIKTTTVSTVSDASTDTVKSPTKLPVFVMNDGTRVPMRPYHSAGSQSWKAIEAIRKFIGDDNRDDFPVGWIFDD
ncbi:MAG: hypothetical protein NXI27_05365 [Alphaproteobacteria bacterium]|nr:hypothetical protein [Alphaproteobacteria bacterium]